MSTLVFLLLYIDLDRKVYFYNFRKQRITGVTILDGTDRSEIDFTYDASNYQLNKEVTDGNATTMLEPT